MIELYGLGDVKFVYMYSTKDVCKILGRSRSTVLKYIKQGVLSCINFGRNKGFEFSKENIDACCEVIKITPNYDVVDIARTNIRDQHIKVLTLKAMRSIALYAVSAHPKDESSIDDLIESEESKLDDMVKAYVG